MLDMIQEKHVSNNVTHSPCDGRLRHRQVGDLAADGEVAPLVAASEMSSGESKYTEIDSSMYLRLVGLFMIDLG